MKLDWEERRWKNRKLKEKEERRKWKTVVSTTNLYVNNPIV